MKKIDQIIKLTKELHKELKAGIDKARLQRILFQLEIVKESLDEK